MSDRETVSSAKSSGRAWRTRMVARSPHETHRVATPLELFFDLVFVVAIAQAAAGLHHAVAELHVVEGLMGYLMVFFAIWWAWMAVAVNDATYLVCLWVLHDRPDYRHTRAFGPIAAVLVLLTPFTGYGVPLTGVILAALVGSKLFIYRNHVRGPVH